MNMEIRQLPIQHPLRANPYSDLQVVHNWMQLLSKWCTRALHQLMLTAHHILHAIMYCIPSCTTCRHVLHAVMYYVPSCTTCHHVLHPIMYYMPSCTTCHHVLHAIMYYMPSCTTCHRILHFFARSVTFFTGCV